LRMKKFLILALALCLPLFGSSAAEPGPANGQEVLKSIWEKFFSKTRAAPSRAEAPGRRVAAPGAEGFTAQEWPWAWRSITYEIIFESREELARSSYGLALKAGDIPGSVGREKFVNGVGGFHYGLDQVCLWANEVFHDLLPAGPEEHRLINWLLLDGAVNILDGEIVPGHRIRHIIGAAAGRKRGLEDALAHERLHVLWDEDKAFRLDNISRWSNLTAEEKKAVFASLPSYTQDSEALLIEEWAVRNGEKLPPEERSKMVGL